MRISAKGIKLIHSCEGCRLKAYKALPHEQYYTIGWGHYGPDVRFNQTITQAEADALFINDIKVYEDRVNKYNSIYNFSQNEFDALVSFCYNIGSINQLTKNGTRDKQTVGVKILEYNKSGGRIIEGLKRRRIAEYNMFFDNADNGYLIAKRVLKKGKKTKEVKILQKNLNELYGFNLAIDGSFGGKTETAVKKMQEIEGLVIDGSYGKKTETAMINKAKALGYIIKER